MSLHHLLSVLSQMLPVYIAAFAALVLLLVKSRMLLALVEPPQLTCGAGPVLWCNHPQMAQQCRRERYCQGPGRIAIGHVPKGPRNTTWPPFHARLAAEARERGPTVRTLFLGDSITESFRGTSLGEPRERCRGIPMQFRRSFGNSAMALGISGDGVANLIWRVLHGELDNMAARAVVLHIGTNDLQFGRRPAKHVFLGLTSLLQYLLHRLPQAHLLVLSILPRGRPREYAAEISHTNQLLTHWGHNRSRVHVVDCGSAFLEGGEIVPDLMPDFLHPSAKGCEALFGCLWAVLQPLRLV
eukprot:GGOE01002231.1.p1 GENE.GGOE01002231.1~~GGOE01002231.1.p1  ORF type:complete len:299 (-),score=63.43 GGOE01002231.1:275-1171(-)